MRAFYYGMEHPNPLQLCLEMIAESNVVAVDIETASLDDETILGIGITNSPLYGFYFMVGSEWMSKAIQILASPRTKVFHNSLFDLPILLQYGFHVTEPIEDTMFLARHKGYPQKLTDLAAFYNYGDIQDIADVLGDKKSMKDLPLDIVATKCIRDIRATIHIYQKMSMESFPASYYIDSKVIPVLAEMQGKGLLVDQVERQRLEEVLVSNLSWYSKVCDQHEFNPASPKQVGMILAKRGNFLPFTKNKKHPQHRTGEEVLESLNDPLAQLVLQFRHDAKQLGTYVLPLKGQERAFTHFHLDAVTARVSSSKRNMQNIPPELRTMFIPDAGIFTDLDFSQIELRVLANISQDPAMLEVFKNPDGTPEGDIHLSTMKAFDIADRRIAKKYNFAMVYGAQSQLLAQICHIPLSTAYSFREAWFKKYKGVARWMKITQEFATKNHYVETMYGRKIYIKEFDMWGGLEDALKRAINYPVQGTAAEIVKIAMVKCRHLPMLLQVHDELLFNGKVVVPNLEDIAGFKTPYKIKLLERWS